jgi:hypothetical protein
MTKYAITKDLDLEGISLLEADKVDPAKAEVLFTFEATDFNSAMAIRNKFLGFEPYVPLSENIVCTRTLTLFDKNKQPLHDVHVIIYQPVKAADDDWRCEYHINIEYKNANGKLIKTENLGGRTIIGYDMVQAIQSAFLIIDSVIFAYNDGRDEKIYWLEYGMDNGFIKK